jgi:epoxyqueuosine reductase
MNDQDTIAVQKEITELITNMGGSFTGFSYVRDLLPEYLKPYPYAITFGIKLSDAIIDEIDLEKPTHNYFNHYRSVNFLIDQINLQILLTLQKRGYNAYTIAASQSIPDSEIPFSGIFPHKTGAVASGLGWIGKNGLFIHKDFGPRVRLGTVLTDMKLQTGNPMRESLCRSCTKCVDACPAKALKGTLWEYGMEREKLLDPQACSVYMNKHFKHIGRGSVCGICIKVCPYK